MRSDGGTEVYLRKKDLLKDQTESCTGVAGKIHKEVEETRLVLLTESGTKTAL
jgi:hypothetical protein